MMSTGVSQSPLASILISNYNYAQFLREAIDSALGQTYAYTEVIVVDDGSTDESREIIAGYGDRIVPVFKENGGMATAINAAFAASHGQLICLLDADDLFVPEKVSSVLKAWESNPNCPVVYHQVQAVDARGRISFGRPSPRAVWCGDIRSRVERSGGWWPYPTTSGLCFSRAFMARLLPIPTKIRVFPDTHLAGPAPFVGPVIGITQPLAMVRFHGQQPDDASGLDHFRQAGFHAESGSESRSNLARRKAKQYAIEFAALQETLRECLNITVPLSLQDVWPYQRCRWVMGDSVTWLEAVVNLLRCPSLPFAMKWREAAKAFLNVRDWRRDPLPRPAPASKST